MLVKLLLLQFIEHRFIEVVVWFPYRKLMAFLCSDELLIQALTALFPELLEELVVVEDLRVFSHSDHVFAVELRADTVPVSLLYKAVYPRRLGLVRFDLATVSACH